MVFGCSAVFSIQVGVLIQSNSCIIFLNSISQTHSNAHMLLLGSEVFTPGSSLLCQGRSFYSLVQNRIFLSQITNFIYDFGMKCSKVLWHQWSIWCFFLASLQLNFRSCWGRLANASLAFVEHFPVFLVVGCLFVSNFHFVSFLLFKVHSRVKM